MPESGHKSSITVMTYNPFDNLKDWTGFRALGVKEGFALARHVCLSVCLAAST